MVEEKALALPTKLLKVKQSSEHIDSLLKDLKSLSSNMQEFEKSLYYAHYLIEIKKSFTDDVMELIRSLMNTNIGFKTDRNPLMSRGVTPYNDEVIINCAVQAMMHGLRIHGNEFNIIGGNFYVTKEGLERIVPSNPNLEEELNTSIESAAPNEKSGNWLIVYQYSYKLKSRAKVNKSLKVIVKGRLKNSKDSEKEFEIPLDAVLGKAKRKLLKHIYNEMNNSLDSNFMRLEDTDDAEEIGLESEKTEKVKISSLTSKTVVE